MTPDDIDRKIEFILQMQTQFETNIGRLEINLVSCETNIDKLRVSVADLAGVVRESAKLSDDRFTRLDERLTKLADAQKAADECSARLDQKMIELAEAQKTTDERLNTLISVVERHITGPDHAARP